jgi:hypothetical protein
MMTPALATIRYTDRLYKPGRTSFEMFKETQDPQTMLLPVSSLKDAHERWNKAMGKCNAHLYAEREALKAAQVAAFPEQQRIFHFEDIEECFSKKGKGTHLLEFEFIPDTVLPVSYISKLTGMPKNYWCWTHKLTKTSVKRYATASGKSYDSGRLSKYLASIMERQHPLAHARAQKILQLNDSNNNTQSPILAPRTALNRKEILRQQVSVGSVVQISFLTNLSVLFHFASVYHR